MSRVATDGSGESRPDWRPVALRCGLEATLVVLIAGYLSLQIESTTVAGVVLVVGLVGSIALVFRCLDEHVLAWVRYASEQGRQRKRRRRRKRQREKQRQK